MLEPKKTKFRKSHRGRMKHSSSRGKELIFGNFGLKALESCWITARQIEAGRRVISRYTRREGKLWIRIFPDKPVTFRPAETRMGSGKGAPEYWVAVVRPNKIIFEIKGVSKNIARQALKIAASKLPIKTQILEQEKL